MQRSLEEVEGILPGPQSLEAAANEEFAGRATSAAAGWDPYEVWRTRVKAAKQTTDESGAALV
ncbi:MAG: hypothetical protein JWL65_5865 [Gammaproteobacteria bacterium]|nr:hypothetical protein [Gammaproteobacteria bacterium]